MADKIGIVVDSTADFPNGLADKMNFHIIPIHISVNDKDYLHGTDIVNQEVVEYLRQRADVSTTPPFPGEYSHAYEELAKKYDRIYSFHVSTELSNCFRCAKNSLNMMPKSISEKINVINTKNVSIGQGLIVKKVMEVINKVDDPDKIDNYIKRLIRKCVMVLAVDNVYWLKKAGKLNMVSSFFGKVLDIKPIIGLDKGKLVPIQKTRGKESAIDSLIKIAQQAFSQQKKETEIWVAHSDALLNALYIRDELAMTLKKSKEEISVMEIGPTMTAHTGPGCLCVAVLPK